MYTSKQSEKGAANFFLSWQFLAFKIFVFALISIYLTHPTGTLVGRVAFEQKGFHLYEYGLQGKPISVVAIGPRGPFSDERGVWVNQDGTFRIDQLPVGEYELRVRSRGFNTEYINDIFVDEGKISNAPQVIKLSMLTPSVTISSNVRVYTTREKPHFNATVSAGKDVSIKIYKEDLQELLANQNLGYGYTIQRDLSLEKSGPDNGDPLEGAKPDYQFYRKVDNSWKDEESEEFAFDKPLSAGDYVAVADATSLDGKEHNFSAMIFTVTDLGLIVKQAPDMTLVRAIDLNTLKPVQGATIDILGRSSTTPVKAVKTQKDGFATLAAATGQGSNHLVVTGAFGVNRAYDSLSYWQSQENTYKTFIYTDRPVYRLGQTVNFKGIVRLATPHGLKNPGAATDVAVKVDDPENSELTTLSLTTNAHGTFHGSFPVPEGKETGSYQIAVSLPDGTTSYGSFSIEQYRKPEFQVEVKPTVPQLVAGTEAQVKVKATYFFGAPVTNARVKYSVYASPDSSLRYSIMPRPAYYSFFDDWSDDDESSHWYSSYAGGGDFEETGFVQTDNTGEAVIKFATKAMTHDSTHPDDSAYCDQNYRVEAEVTDLTRMSVTSSGSLLATPANFELFVSPDSYVTKVGESFQVSVSAIDYHGKPVAHQALNLKLQRFLYDRRKGEYRGVDVKATISGVTDQNGVLKASFLTKDQWPCDTFFVTAEGLDNTGHMAYGESSVWIANDARPFIAFSDAAAEKQPLEIKLNKEIYKPGETARIMISAPVRGDEGVEALVSLEGTRLYSYKLVPLTATASMIELPIKTEYMPNVYVSVSFVGKKHQFYTTQRDIKVSPEENFLNLAVSSDKQKYKPGDQVKYTIKATHLDGKPAPNCEVSLGLVDESIYAIMPDMTGNIQKFFYSKRENSVVTSTSFPEEYSGGPDKTEPHVRKDFKDTAAWLPTLTTDRNGVALASVKLPDNLTTWRATVRGVDMNTCVGAALEKITVTQDLIVRLGVPRFFTQEDESTVSAVVHNYTEKEQAVKLTFTTSPQFSTAKPLVQMLQVAPDKSARIDWPVTAKLAGIGTVAVKAIGQTASDAVEETFTVRPLGVPSFSARAGLLTGDNQSVKIPLGLSADTAKGTAQFQVSLAGSSIGPVLGNFDALIKYPYGCTEQTLSRMVPSIVAFKLHKELGLPISAREEQRFDEVYAASMEKLSNYRHPDGGWGWWENDPSQPYLTCLVVDGLTLMNSCQHYADQHEEWLKGAKGWIAKALGELEKQLSSKDLVKEDNEWLLTEYRTDICFMLYTQGLLGGLDAKQTDWMLARYQALPPEGLSYLTLTLKGAGRQADAQKCYDRLMLLANVHGDYIDWEHTREMVARLKLKGASEEYTYRYTGVETTALALRAVLAMEPDNTKRIEAVKQWLLLQRGKDGWGNTKTTAEVFEVLLQEELMAKAKAPINFTADATVGKDSLAKLLKEYVFSGASAYQQEQQFEIPADALAGELTLTKKGSGRLYYSTMFTGFRKLHAGDQIAQKATPNGLKLSRQFYRIVAQKMKSDGSMHFRSELITDGKVKAGETILMKVLVETPISIPYVILEAALPSGGEVVRNSAQDSAQASDDHSFEGDWTQPWWTHEDLLDDRIVFFGTRLPAGKSEFHTLVRMEIPGKLNVDPVSLEGMYTNRVRGYSQLDSLTVTE